jgi:hypothetical protein
MIIAISIYLIVSYTNTKLIYLDSVCEEDINQDSWSANRCDLATENNDHRNKNTDNSNRLKCVNIDQFAPVR